MNKYFEKIEKMKKIGRLNEEIEDLKREISKPISMKVFELAKLMDVGALELVEKLKSAKFPIRNHMSSIDGDLLVGILTYSLLNKESLVKGQKSIKCNKRDHSTCGSYDSSIYSYETEGIIESGGYEFEQHEWDNIINASDK